MYFRSSKYNSMYSSLATVVVTSENWEETSTGIIIMSWIHTELPTGLDKGQLRVVDQERHSAPEKVGLGLEIGIEDGHVIALFHVAVLHALFQSTRLVSVSVVPYLVSYIYPFARPFLTLHLHQILHHYHYLQLSLRLFFNISLPKKKKNLNKISTVPCKYMVLTN